MGEKGSFAPAVALPPGGGSFRQPGWWGEAMGSPAWDPGDLAVDGVHWLLETPFWVEEGVVEAIMKWENQHLTL